MAVLMRKPALRTPWILFGNVKTGRISLHKSHGLIRCYTERTVQLSLRAPALFLCETMPAKMIKQTSEYSRLEQVSKQEIF